MAVTDEKDGALATAAVAAAAGVAAYGLRKALSSGSSSGSSLLPGRSDDDDADGGNGDGGGRFRGGGSILQTAWESASEALLPLAEDAADAAGKWAAENSPEVIRDRIMPRFLEAFNDAA